MNEETSWSTARTHTRTLSVISRTKRKNIIFNCDTKLNNSGLDFQIGPHCITAVCVADDTCVMTSSPSSIQSALDAVSHYGKRYQLKFNADKTKIVITGSKHDITFYQETRPWTLNGERVQVTDKNEHLGLVVSGIDE